MKSARDQNQCQCSRTAAGGLEKVGLGAGPGTSLRTNLIAGQTEIVERASQTEILERAGQVKIAERAGRSVLGLLSGASLALIRAYQLTRYLRQPSCRFYPSCSQYTLVAVKRFGPARGLLLGSLRLLRCHPFHAGGYDEVPVEFFSAFPGWFLEIGRIMLGIASSAKVTMAIPVCRGGQARGKG